MSVVQIAQFNASSNTASSLFEYKLTEREELLKSSLVTFYQSHPDAFNTFDIIIKGKHTAVTLRLLDYYVCAYCKKKNITYANGFNVYLSYKNQLRSFSKKLFDIFCRREKIYFSVGENSLFTTLSQLNFLRWAISNGVVETLAQEAVDIEACMISDFSSSAPSSSKQQGRKRKLVTAAVKNLTSSKVSITLKW